MFYFAAFDISETVKRETNRSMNSLTFPNSYQPHWNSHFTFPHCHLPLKYTVNEGPEFRLERVFHVGLSPYPGTEVNS